MDNTASDKWKEICALVYDMIWNTSNIKISSPYSRDIAKYKKLLGKHE